ncbi:MAG: hypothetical protein AB7V36_14920 [Bacteroidales bacterium]
MLLFSTNMPSLTGRMEISVYGDTKQSSIPWLEALQSNMRLNEK